MSESLYDAYGARKYLVPQERLAFVEMALSEDAEFSAFCLTLAITGARISEVLALVTRSIDAGDEGIVFQTLKQRGKRKFRLVPVPASLVELLIEIARGKDGGRLWAFGRTHAWRRVKDVMRMAGIASAQCVPKSLRHGFAIEAVLEGIPLNVLQRWMGHARLETTAIYAGVVGEEERKLARRVWSSLELAISDGKDLYGRGRSTNQRCFGRGSR
jgi:integrase/recombinase XerD